jgi:hypothetical protein
MIAVVDVISLQFRWRPFELPTKEIDFTEASNQPIDNNGINHLDFIVHLVYYIKLFSSPAGYI